MLKIREIKKEVKEYFKDAKGSHDWNHIERVYKLSLKIGEKEKQKEEESQPKTLREMLQRIT